MTKKSYSFMFITFLVMFFSFKCNVFADASTVSLDVHKQVGAGVETNLVDHTGYWANWSGGTFVFSFSLSGYVTETIGGQAHNYLRLPRGVHIHNGISDVACDLGNNLAYYDNQSTEAIFSVTCNNMAGFGAGGLTWLTIEFNEPIGSPGVSFVSNEWIHTSRFMTYYTNVAYDDIVSAVNSTTSAINSQMSSFTQKQQETTNAINSNGVTINNSIQSASSQAHQDANDIKNNTKETNDLIKNDNIDTSSANSNANNWNSKNASNGVITQLLTLPITLLNAIVNGIQTSCLSFNLGNLFGTDIILPCINLSSLIGGTLFSTIDLLISGFMIYNISKKLIKIFNDFTNLKSNQIDDLYGGGNN